MTGRRHHRNGFVRGLLTGAGLSLLLGGVVLYLLAVLGVIRLDLLQTPHLDQVYRWLLRNRRAELGIQSHMERFADSVWKITADLPDYLGEQACADCIDRVYGC